LNIFKAWRWFFKFGVVDETDTGTDELDLDDVAPVDDAENTTEEAETTETVEEFIDKATDEPLTEEKEEVKPEVKAEEPKVEEKPKEGLTDADLAPLNSKNPATNERFEKLVNNYKELQTKVQEYETVKTENEAYKQSFQALEQLGFNDEGAAQSLLEFSQYRNAIKTGDVETFRVMLENEIQQFELLTGKRVNVATRGIDKYEDLRQKVDSQQISEDDAAQLARMRRLEERATIARQTQYQQATAQQEIEQITEKAVVDVKSYRDTLMRQDPDAKAVFDALTPFLPEILDSFPPQQWLKALETNYKATKAAMVKAQPPKQTFTPLRANSSKGGKPMFKSVAEEVDFLVDDDNWG
jgi:hypothetical protein